MKTSDQFGDLVAAFAKAQAAFGQLLKTKTAKVPTKSGGEYSYRYSTLDDMIEATRKPLTDHGIAVAQPVRTANGDVIVTTVLLHTSGQFMELGEVSLPGGGTPQSVGSAITYARRYSMGSALGIAAEEDDDGVAAQKAGKAPAKRAAAPATRDPQPAPPPAQERPAGVISDAQRKRLWTIASNAGWTKDDMAKLLKDHFGFESSKDITIARYDQIVESVENGTLPQGKAS
jgi:hypothetical protein